jgi:hypothetical protein
VTGIQDAARTAMAAKLITDVVAAEHKPVKADLLDRMVDNGVERVRVVDVDGDNLGAVTLNAGRKSAKVTDPAEFTAWVADRYPGEMVQAVRESFVKKLLDAATAENVPVDTATGEVIPGVEIVAGEPYLTVRPNDLARTRMRATLLASGLLQLPGGDDAPR